MPDPVLHIVAGPNGAGKSTLYERVLEPATHLDVVNADVIALERFPHDPAGHAYEAAAIATELRSGLIEARQSFVTETVFSHESKLDLVHAALDAGYLVTVHVVVVPEELAVARVRNRVAVGGHAVPTEKIRQRYRRVWPLVARAIGIVDAATVYDNTKAKTPFRVVASFDRGSLVCEARWPSWTPAALREITG